MIQNNDPLLIVISAPSGSGKTTLVTDLIETVPGIKRSVSYTTRSPRQGEKNREDYVFISQDEFKKKIDNGEFLEWEENFGSYYGTSKDQVQEALERGDDIVLSIDVKGARKVKELFPESISIFIMPPSIETLAERLRKRNTDEEEQVSMRLREAQKELSATDEYDYMIVNRDLEKAREELRTIINMERETRKKNQKKVKG